MDEGDPPTKRGTLLRELRNKPGRLGNAVRTTCVALIVILVLETFQAPDVGAAVGISLIVFVGDSDLTVPIGVLLAIVVCTSILVTIVTFMTTLSEPALRIPLMALITFGGTFLFKASKAGAPAMLATLIVVRALPAGDSLLKGSLAAGTASNTTTGALPDLVFFPPEEALVHNMLWLTLAFSLPALTASILNALTGVDPARKFHSLIAARLALIADYCDGRPGGAERLKATAEQGTGAILAQNELAGRCRKRTHDARAGEDLIFIVSRLALIFLANERVKRELPQDALATTANLCRHGAGAVLANENLAGRRDEPDGAGDVPPLEAELAQVLHALRARLEKGLREKPGDAPVTKEHGGFFQSDAFTQPAHVQFAIKVTVAVMFCYLFESLSDWSGIGTCLITCFVIAMSPGQSEHKALLRMSGAVLGGMLGFVTIFLLIPTMTDIGQLLGLAAAVSLPCAWVLVGSERLAYGAQQLWLAFSLVVLQENGPSIHFQPARDRVIGVLLGELALAVVMLNLWPQRTGDLIRSNLAEALDRLADLVALPTGEATAVAAQRLQRRFGATIGATRKLMPDDPHPGAADHGSTGRAVGKRVLLRIEELLIPIAVILGTMMQSKQPGREAQDAGSSWIDYHRDLAAWFHLAAQWARTGSKASELSDSLPVTPFPAVAERPLLPDGSADEVGRLCACETWYRVLDEDLRSLLRDVGPVESDQVRRARSTPTLA